MKTPRFPGYQACVALMRKSDPKLQEEGFHALLPHAAEHIAALIEDFRAENACEGSLRYWFLELIAEAKSPTALALLTEQLHAPDENLRYWAAHGLQALDTPETRRRLFMAGALQKTATVLLVLLATAGKALACSICVNRLASSILPPFWLWVSLAVSWFLVTGIVREVTGCVLPGQPTFIKALLVVLMLLLVGASVVGFPILLFLFLPPLIAFVRIVRASPTLSLSDKATRALRLIGYVHVAGIAVASILLVSTCLTRSPKTSLLANTRHTTS